MKCVVCGTRTSVIDSRELSDGSVRRRRHCKKCDRRFTTREPQPPVMNTPFKRVQKVEPEDDDTDYWDHLK